MKKLFLLFIAGIFLLSFMSLVVADNCQVAYPMMEVLKCDKANSITQNINFNCQGSDCTATYTCISDCTFNVKVDCGALSGIVGEVSVDGNPRGDLSNFLSGSGTAEVDNIKAGDGQSILVTAKCERLFIGYPVKTDTSYIAMQDYNKYLYADNHEWSSHQLTDTKNCIPQTRVSNFLRNQVTSGDLPSVYTNGGTDALGNDIATYTSEYSISNINLNSELKIGETLSYFYRWEVVPGINLVYDKDKKPVYCGGSSDQRKIINYNQITTDGGCYYVPSTLNRNVECCLDGDCHFSNQLCGPDFSCTDKKPCNGIYDCGTEDNSCINNQVTSWTCDASQGPVNMPNGQTYSGWCKKENKEVKCCPNSCQNGFHCVEDSGCISDVRVIDCPSNSCCKSGGNYREKSCDVGQCCTAQGSFVGICAADCSTLNSQDLQNAGLQDGLSSTKSGGSSTGTIILIIFLIIIFGAIGFFIYVKNKKKGHHHKEEKTEVKHSGKHCTKCGHPLKAGSLFCTKCGKKLKKSKLKKRKKK